MEFEYKIELVGEGEYGRLDATTGRWSGLMEKLVEGVGSAVKLDKYEYHLGERTTSFV